MQDLSNLFSDPLSALVVTSQAGGNMQSSNNDAMTAPGSKPTDPLPDRSEQGQPKVTASPGPQVVKGGKDHHPGSTYSPGPPAWKNTK